MYLLASLVSLEARVGKLLRVHAHFAEVVPAHELVGVADDGPVHGVLQLGEAAQVLKVHHVTTVVPGYPKPGICFFEISFACREKMLILAHFSVEKRLAS